jgi:hypothetical protein
MLEKDLHMYNLRQVKPSFLLTYIFILIFIQIQERVSVELALKLNDTKLGTRKIRVMRCEKGNHVNSKSKIGKAKFGKELMEGVRVNSKYKHKKGKSIQKHNRLVKKKFEDTRTKKARSRTQA